MKLGKGPVSEADVRSLGRYFLELYRDHSWVVRRVETVHILDRNRVERRITLDLDLARLEELSKQFLGGQPVKTVLVPLTLLDKGLFLDFTVTGPEGSPLHLLSSDIDSRAAQLLLLARASEVGALGRLTPAMREKLYRIAKEFPGSAGLDTDAYLTSQLSVDDADHIPRTDYRTWVNLFNDDEMLQLTSTFALKYMPIVRVPIGDGHDGIELVKMTFIDPAVSPNEQSRLALEPSGFFVSVPGIGRSQREHVRVLAPVGTEIAGAALIKTVASSGSDARLFLSPGKFFLRTSPDRAVVYAKGTGAPALMDVVFSLWPTAVGFVRPALFTTLASAILLACGALAEGQRRFLTQKLEGNLDAAVALMLVVPTLYSIYLSRSDEHELRSFLLRKFRYAVFGAAVAHGLAVVSLLSMKMTASSVLVWSWSVGAGYCCLVFLYLAVFAWQRHRSMDGVRSRMSTTAGPLPILAVVR